MTDQHQAGIARYPNCMQYVCCSDMLLHDTATLNACASPPHTTCERTRKVQAQPPYQNFTTSKKYDTPRVCRCRKLNDRSSAPLPTEHAVGSTTQALNQRMPPDAAGRIRLGHTTDHRITQDACVAVVDGQVNGSCRMRVHLTPTTERKQTQLLLKSRKPPAQTVYRMKHRALPRGCFPCSSGSTKQAIAAPTTYAPTLHTYGCC
jgi:hypothetical protein